LTLDPKIKNCPWVVEHFLAKERKNVLLKAAAALVLT
jgi:hypothetical protein